MSSGGFNTHPWWKKILLSWTHTGSEYFAEWIANWKVEPLIVAFVFLFALIAIATDVDPGAVTATFAMLIALSPIWVPIYLATFLITSWVHYVRYIFWFRQEYVLVEIELPPEVEKSPKAIEIILTGMWNIGGETTFIHRVFKGQQRLVWSLEIAGTEGHVGFYIYMRRVWKSVIEARFYGQFPECRFHEVDDYITRVPYDSTKYSLFAAEHAKAGSSAHPLPIRTYVDYGLDKDPDKPETVTDPIVNTLETMGQLGKGEYMWMQLIIRPRKNDEWYGFYRKSGLGFDTLANSYTESGKAEIDKITKGAIARAQKFTEDETEKKKVGVRGSTLLSPVEKDRVEAIERSMSKLVFDCGLRTVYMAEKDKFDLANIGSIVRFFNAYRYPNFGVIAAARGHPGMDYPWQDWGNVRKEKIARNMYFWSKHRAFFFVPHDQKETCLTTEEVATLWHFPNSQVKTPGLRRVPSRVSEAPPNLPV